MQRGRGSDVECQCGFAVVIRPQQLCQSMRIDGVEVDASETRHSSSGVPTGVPFDAVRDRARTYHPPTPPQVSSATSSSECSREYHSDDFRGALFNVRLSITESVGELAEQAPVLATVNVPLLPFANSLKLKFNHPTPRQCDGVAKSRNVLFASAVRAKEYSSSN